MSPRLTVNYGLRYDYFEPVKPRKPGGIANFDPSTGQILFGGLGDVSDSANIATPKTDFAPRLGVAYKLTQSTVIRAGLGRSYFSSGYDATFYHLTSFYPIVSQQNIPQPSVYQAVFPLDQGPPPGTPPTLPPSGHLPAPQRNPAESQTIQLADGNDGCVELHHRAGPFKQRQRVRGVRGCQGHAPSQSINMECNCSDSNYNSLQVQLNKR